MSKQVYQNYLGSLEWKLLRKKAIERDEGKCSFCNGKFNAVHHITYPKRFKDDHLDNLVCVCKKCHNRLHGINDNEVELQQEVERRVGAEWDDNGLPKQDYWGLDFSGGIITDPIMTQEESRKHNFNLVMKNFRDYLPNMKLENFKLWSWKGSMWWGNENQGIIVAEKDFSGDTTSDVITWIIKNKWGGNGNSKKIKR